MAFLEYDLFLNGCIQNQLELMKMNQILSIFQLDDRFNHIKDITNDVINELKLNNYFKVIYNLKVIITKDNKIIII